MFLAVLAAAHASALGATRPARTQPALQSLEDSLEPVRKKHELPALAAAVITDGRLSALGATGVRKAGTNVSVTRSDAFHIGSCTKAMTATLLAILIDQGRLRWETTLAEAAMIDEEIKP